MKSLLFVALASLMFTASAVAGDAAAGKVLSSRCSVCHGTTGISISPIWPNLAGQKELYLVKQIKAFRDGIRKDPTMAPMVIGLTDDDVANLAAYFSTQK